MQSNYVQIFDGKFPLGRGSICELRSNMIYYELDYKLKQPAMEYRETYV